MNKDNHGDAGEDTAITATSDFGIAASRAQGLVQVASASTVETSGAGWCKCFDRVNKWNLGGNMAWRVMLITATLLLVAPAQAQQRPGPAGSCVNAVYNSMDGIWGLDTPEFDPNRIPADAWQVFRYDSEIVIQLTAGETNMWFPTEHGADFVHQTGREQYEGVYRATQLLSCQESVDGRPAVIESLISVSLPERAMLRERIEVVPGRTLVITRFNPQNGEVVSERRMRAHALPPDPPPPPPRPR